MSDEDIARAIHEALGASAFHAYINPFEMPPEAIDDSYDSVEGYGVTVDGSFNFRVLAEKVRASIFETARSAALEEAARVAERIALPEAIAAAIRALKTEYPT